MKYNVTKLGSFVLGVTLLVALSACGKVPGAYQGKFKDATTGASLVMEQGGGTLRTSSGREIKAEAKDMEFDQLLEGRAGIYMSKNPTAKTMMDIFWISPKLQTRQSRGGLVWFESEVVHAMLDLEAREKVPFLELIHAESGLVTLDLSTKRWQIGWPANPVHYRMERIH